MFLGARRNPTFSPASPQFSTSRTGHPPRSVQMCCRILETQNGNELLLSTLDSSSGPFFLRWHRISLWLIKPSGHQSSFPRWWLYQNYSLNRSGVRLYYPFLLVLIWCWCELKSTKANISCGGVDAFCIVHALHLPWHWFFSRTPFFQWNSCDITLSRC